MDGGGRSYWRMRTIQHIVRQMIRSCRIYPTQMLNKQCARLRRLCRSQYIPQSIPVLPDQVLIKRVQAATACTQFSPATLRASLVLSYVPVCIKTLSKNSPPTSLAQYAKLTRLVPDANETLHEHSLLFRPRFPFSVFSHLLCRLVVAAVSIERLEPNDIQASCREVATSRFDVVQGLTWAALWYSTIAAQRNNGMRK